MNNIQASMKRIVVSLFILTLVLTGVGAEGYQAEGAAINAKEVAVVYYLHNDDLYRIRTDGSPAKEIQADFDGYDLKAAGSSIYYQSDKNPTALLRLSTTDESPSESAFSGDMTIVYYETHGDFIYFMNDKGNLYRAPSTAKSYKEAKLVVDKADTEFPGFKIVEGKVYYNAIRNGRATWVASRSADGRGELQWIAAGAIEDIYYARTDSTHLTLMINTKPEEQSYSTDCMVLYTLPKKGGKATAVNAKSPIDANAVDSGSWAGDGSFLYNKGILLDAEHNFDYTKGKGVLIQKSGARIDLSKSSVTDIATVDKNKYVYLNDAGKAFVSTVANNKVTGTKTLPVKDVASVSNLMKNGQVQATILFTEDSSYIVRPDSTLKKMEGVSWDISYYEDDINGIFYINTADSGSLYRMGFDGKTTLKLTNDAVSHILLVAKG